MKIVQATNSRAPIILLYGAEGRGKSTLACKFPKPLALLLERGLPKGVTVDAVDVTFSYSMVTETLRELIKDPHGYQTLIVDTVDALEPMLLDHVCQQNGWRNIEQPSYGKGWLIADKAWQHFIAGITALRDKHNVTIVLVGHSTIDTVNDPRAPSYTAYSVKLHKRAKGLILVACDIVGFLSEDINIVTDDRDRTRATSSKQRFLFCEGQPAFQAKNRYGIAAKVPIPADFDVAGLTKCWSVEND